MNNDFNFDLVTEDTVWTKERVWDAEGREVSKENMQEEVEYVIF